MKILSRRTLAAGRKLLIDQRAAEPAEYPPGPRLAFEAGDSKAESDLFVALHARAALGDAEAAKFLLRIRGHRESGNPIAIEGPKITLILPGSFPATEAGERAHMDSVGQLEVIDSRTPEKIREMELIRLNAPKPQNMKEINPAEETTK